MSQPKRREVAEATLAMIKANKSPAHIAKSLAAFLVDTRRSREVDALIRDLESIRFQRDKVLEATVSSAHPIDQAIVKRIENLFDAKTVKVSYHADPELVGGVRVRALDKQLDLSVESKLKQLKVTTRE